MGPALIEDVSPQVDGGRYRVKAIAGDAVVVTARIFRDGPGLLSAVVRWRGPGARSWNEAPMAPLGNDWWGSEFVPDRLGRWEYCVKAWPDEWATWLDGFRKKVEAGVDVGLERQEAHELLKHVATLVPKSTARSLDKSIAALNESESDQEAAAVVLDDRLTQLLTPYPDRSAATETRPILGLEVERERARAGAWYELFPRSNGMEGRHGTFATAAKNLGRVAEMGFDVVYLPPIHPIGTTNRKGRNNSLAPDATDVGSPWAIGSAHGGHDAVHPELGTLEDFDAFVAAADKLGLEIALDYAIQCSPDHPWVREHPEWFHHRPDGSIQTAENPPKKYQDIYPINFGTEDREGLWHALKGIIDHWISHGVRIFRVDNPHTKPFAFWEWLIQEVRAEHPDVIFLSEAFTRPPVMYALAKLGFSQSYTYFTWRNTKWELVEYMTELTSPQVSAFFRPNFFVNTPDILHEYLQVGGPTAFKIRLVLASLLSPSYGIYSGYELFERTPAHSGSEEYLNSEKYELKNRDWDDPSSLAPYIRQLNEIRRKYRGLSRLTNLVFHHIDNDRIVAFSKSDGSDTILAIVNLNPVHWEEGVVHLDLDALGVDAAQPFRVHDLVSENTYMWAGPANYVKLDPFVEPAHVFRIEA